MPPPLSDNNTRLNPDGWTRVPNSVLLDVRTAKLTGAELRVLLLLMAHRNCKTGLAWPSQKTLGQLAGLHRSTVAEAVAGLRRARMIKAQRAWHAGATRLVYSFPSLDRCRQGPTTVSHDQCRPPPTTVNGTDVACGRDQCRPPPQPMSPAGELPLKERTDEDKTSNSSSEDAAAAAAAEAEEFIRERHGASAAAACRDHLAGCSIDKLAQLDLLAAKADRPAAFLIAAIRNGYDVPRRRPADGSEPQTDEQRARNVSERVCNTYSLAMAEATPQQRYRIEAAFGCVATLIAADPLGFAGDRRPSIPVETLDRLLELAEAPRQLLSVDEGDA